MIHWMDSFMALFGFKRPEVCEADRKEHDVTFPAPHAEKANTQSKQTEHAEEHDDHR